MTPPSSLEQRHRRIQRVVALVPLALLLASTLLSWLFGARDWTQELVTAGLAAIAGAWVWLMAMRREPGPVFVVGLLALIAVLATRSIWYAVMFGFAGYLYSWTVLRGAWRWIGLTAAAAINTAALTGWPPADPGGAVSYVLLVTLTVGLVSVFCMVGDVTAERTTGYRRALSELEQAMEENERLHARLVAQAREAGVRDERQRMAREIHDTLAQGLTGIVTQLHAAERAGSDGDGELWRHHLDHAIRLTKQSLDEARRSVHAIGPSQLDAARLPDAIAAIAADWTDRHDVPVSVAATGAVRALDPEVEATLLRVAQEALSNAEKHAGATRVGVTLSYMDDQISLDIRDDGRGFDPADASRRGRYGLVSMRQRVSRWAGTLEIESAPGAGTAISASLPLTASAREGRPT